MVASVPTPSLSNSTSNFLPGMTASCLNLLSFPLCVCWLACYTPAVSLCFLTHNPQSFVFLPVFLCVFESCSEMLSDSHTHTVSNPLPGFHAHTASRINKRPSLGILLKRVSTSQVKLKVAWIMYLNESDTGCTNKVCFSPSVYTLQFFLKRLADTHSSARKREKAR